jgi:glycosyltransferase involved in cell wall biosynthesis
MKTAWLLPLEPFESRYTGQWYKSFPKEFTNAGYFVQLIDGVPLADKIDVGSWLPMNSTVHYKNTQLARIASAFQEGQVKDGDIFFVYDLEFWGVESIKMMAQINNIEVDIYAFLHAASYTKEDLMEQLTPWQKYTELGWLSICTKVFVGSAYHKQAVIERRILPFADKNDIDKLSDKIVVTGNPLFKDDYHEFICVEKKNQIIISNRFDYEKRPNISLDIAQIIKCKHPDWGIIVTTGNETLSSNQNWLVTKARLLEAAGVIQIYEHLTKEEYHHHLAESKVMLTNSIEENFGYCIVEAMLYNTAPVAPFGLSHTELLKNNYNLLYNDIDGAVKRIEALMFRDMSIELCPIRDLRPWAAKYFNVAKEIVDLTKEQ